MTGRFLTRAAFLARRAARYAASAAATEALEPRLLTADPGGRRWSRAPGVVARAGCLSRRAGLRDRRNNHGARALVRAFGRSGPQACQRRRESSAREASFR